MSLLSRRHPVMKSVLSLQSVLPTDDPLGRLYPVMDRGVEDSGECDLMGFGVARCCLVA